MYKLKQDPVGLNILTLSRLISFIKWAHSIGVYIYTGIHISIQPYHSPAYKVHHIRIVFKKSLQFILI